MPSPPRPSLRAALRAFLRARAAAHFSAHPAHALAELRPSLGALAGELTGQQARMRALEAHLDAQLARARAPQARFAPNMTMETVLRRHPRAREVLASHHLPACGRCAVRFDETLAEAAEAYELPLATLLAELNDLLPAPGQRRASPREPAAEQGLDTPG